MQLVDVAAVALPQFCRALRSALAAAAAADPELGVVALGSIRITVESYDDGLGFGVTDHYRCTAEVTGESPCSSSVHLPDLDEPERIYERFLSEVQDWIVESRFGWGLKLE